MAAPSIISPDIQIELLKGFGSAFGLFIVDDVVRATANTVAYFTDANGDYTETPITATPDPDAQWVQTPINDGEGNIVGSNNVLLNPNGDIVIQFTNALQGSGIAQQGPDFNTQLKAIAPDIAADPILKEAVSKALPENTKETLGGADISQQYESLSDVGKATVDAATDGGANVANQGLKKAFQKVNSRADHARVSKERHEWAYCCDEGKSQNMELLKGMDSGFKLTWIDSDFIGTTNKGPPYWGWIKFDDFRRIIYLIRKYRRLRSGCNAKALWENQGFTSKDDAIQDDLKNDSEYPSLRTALQANAEWGSV